MNTIAPEIINIMAASIDGSIARHSSESTDERMESGFTNSADQDFLKNLVSTCGAIFIGWRSMQAESGAFRVRVGTDTQSEPEWIVFTHSGDIDFSHQFWQQEKIPKSIFLCSDFSPDAPPQLREEFHHVRGSNVTSRTGTLTGLLQHLAQRNIARVALLGGGRLNSLFWEHNLPQRLFLTLSPVLLGRSSSIPLLEILSTPRRLKLLHSKKRQGLLFLEFERADGGKA